MAVEGTAAASSGSDQMSGEGFNSTQFLVNYMLMEADLADQKAKRLREQANDLARRFGVSLIAQEVYEINPSEMPPLGEDGLPKYKGKKRGRKPKARKRKTNPNRKKRQHTGYTLYMHDHYPAIKEANPDFASKDVITIVAKQWADLSLGEKADWKARAAATHEPEDDDEEGVVAEEVDEEDDEDDEPAPPARRTAKRSKR